MIHKGYRQRRACALVRIDPRVYPLPCRAVAAERVRGEFQLTQATLSCMKTCTAGQWTSC